MTDPSYHAPLRAGFFVADRHSARVYFLYFPDNSIVFWLFVHTKKEIDELSNRGKEQIRQTAEEIKKLLERPA